jgi:hypothetical protein
VGGLASMYPAASTRPLLTQHNCTALIQTYDVKRVLADIDADDGNCAVETLRHGVLLVAGAPCQLRSLAGQEHAWTIPLADNQWLNRSPHLRARAAYLES